MRGYRIVCAASFIVSFSNHRPYQGPVSRKSRELFGPEKPFVKLRPAYSVKLVFSYVVKGIKIKVTAKFRASRRLRFEETKRIMPPEIRPKSFGTFEKQAPGEVLCLPDVIILCNSMESKNRGIHTCRKATRISKRLDHQRKNISPMLESKFYIYQWLM